MHFTREMTRRVTLGLKTEQNPDTGQLAAIAYVTQRMLPENHNRRTILYTRNKGAKVTIRQPRQPAGQGYICRIYDVIETSRDRGTGVLIMTPAR